METGKKTSSGIIKPFLFAISITTATFIALQEANLYNNLSSFAFFSILIFLIYFLELIIEYRKRSPKFELNFDFNDEVNELAELFHKIILPIALYCSVIIFGKYNYTTGFLPILLLFVFLIFFLLFTNITAFFKRRLKTEHKTHYVYDIIKFVIFFTLSDVLIHIYLDSSENVIVFAILCGLLGFVLIYLMIWRLELIRIVALLLTLLSSIGLTAAFFILQSVNRFSVQESSLILLFIFYFAVAIIHHWLMKTLTFKVVSEYASVILLLLAVTYGIT